MKIGLEDKNIKQHLMKFTISTMAVAVAALTHYRKFIGFELEQKYFDIAKERIEYVGDVK